MTDNSISLLLFGETLELRTSALMGVAVPINGFFTNGQTAADLALIRPYDGIVQFNEAAIAATVEAIRRRNSGGYRVFFAIATPILLALDVVFATLRGIGRVFGAMSVFGIFSAILGLIALAAIIMTLGAMAMVAVYALPVLAVVYLTRLSYRSGNEDAARKIKDACQTLARQLPHDTTGV